MFWNAGCYKKGWNVEDAAKATELDISKIQDLYNKNPSPD
jgi:hypothetical protein